MAVCVGRTNTSFPQSKFPLIFPCFWTGSVLSFCGLLYHSCPQGSRETGNFIQSLKLNQSFSHACVNFSNVFVAELVVLASVNLLATIGRSAFSLVLPGSVTLEWLALCECDAQKSTARDWLVHVLDSLCPGCRFTLSH